MKTAALLVLLALAAAPAEALPPVRILSTSPDPGRVDGRLAEVLTRHRREALEGAGLAAPAGPELAVFRWLLGSGGRYEVGVDAGPGEVVLVAVGDEDCRDLDLTVYGADGRVVARDIGEAAHALVRFAAAAPDRYVVRVAMARCSADPCFFELAAFDAGAEAAAADAPAGGPAADGAVEARPEAGSGAGRPKGGSSDGSRGSVRP